MMKEYRLVPEQMSYNHPFDMLYATYGENSLDVADEIFDLEPNMTIMFRDGELSGIEISDFKENYHTDASENISIQIDDIEGYSPFVVVIPNIF